ncbi:MAG: cyanophycin synthetase, partial [FCB group bacterium]|nr:cyanophycin synthetase [FCB group bacterium]
LDGESIRNGCQVIAKTSDTVLPGRHNLQNVLCALAMMRAGEFNWPRVLEGLRGFKGVEHRIEHVACVDGVEYFNDSKSTNIDSLKVALESFPKPVVLIVGGQGKGADYRVLCNLVSRGVKHMITIGEDAPLLEEAFEAVVTFERAKDMVDAVERAARAAEPGEAVLLSPACASFDMYNDFEHRGRVFKDIVRTRAERVSP